MSPFSTTLSGSSYFARLKLLEYIITFATYSQPVRLKLYKVIKPLILDATMSYYLNINNNSHYISETSKTKFRLINPNNFTAQKSRQLSYYVRLYYHHQHILSLGGQTYFYTFTYNDRALPHYCGERCFDLRHIDWFMRDSGFDKKLLRDYGYKLQYFVSCELGDGKGVRGYAGNPHYHVLFFLVPHKVKKYITPSDFQSLVRAYWQGCNKRPRDYRFGIAMPGDNLGFVNSCSAISYVSKYVLKDITYRQLFCSLRRAKEHFIKIRLEKISTARAALYRYCVLNNCAIDSPKATTAIGLFVRRIFNNLYRKDVLNIYMPKVRISQGVGLYALEKVNTDGLTISIPIDHKTIKSVTIPQYLYRKMYYNVVKDDAGNNKYVLNESGINVRARELPSKIQKSIYEVESVCKFYAVDTIKWPSDILKRYVVYDIIYRDRLLVDNNVTISPIDDYRDFQLSEYYTTNYISDVDRVLMLYNRSNYINHPYFSKYKKYFDFLDKLLEKHYFWQNNKLESDYQEKLRLKKIHSVNKFNNYVAHL